MKLALFGTIAREYFQLLKPKKEAIYVNYYDVNKSGLSTHRTKNPQKHKIGSIHRIFSKPCRSGFNQRCVSLFTLKSGLSSSNCMNFFSPVGKLRGLTPLVGTQVVSQLEGA